MTGGAEILARLEAAGLSIRAQEGNLIARPREALTDELRGLIQHHRAELLAEIEAQRAARIAQYLDDPPAPEERVRELMGIVIEPSLEPVRASRGRSHFRRLLAHAFVSDVVDLRAYIEGRHDLGIRQTAGLLRQELPHLSRASFATRWALLIRAVTYLFANLEARAELVSWRKGEAMLKDEADSMAAAFAGFFAGPEDGRTAIAKGRRK